MGSLLGIKRIAIILVLGILLWTVSTAALPLTTRGQHGLPASLAPAAEALASPVASERAAAVQALRASGNPAAVPLLLGQLDDPDQQVGLYTAQALVELGDESLARSLTVLLYDANSDVRWRAAYVLGMSRSGRAVDALGYALNDANPLVANSAGDALAQIGGRRAANMLAGGLGSSRASTVHAAMAGLEKLGEQAVPALTLALDSKDAQTRLNAATVLGYIGSPQSAPALQLATVDTQPDVRAEAAWALGQIKG